MQVRFLRCGGLVVCICLGLGSVSYATCLSALGKLRQISHQSRVSRDDHELISDIHRLAHRRAKEWRSADRAVLKTLLGKLRRQEIKDPKLRAEIWPVLSIGAMSPEVVDDLSFEAIMYMAEKYAQYSSDPDASILKRSLQSLAEHWMMGGETRIRRLFSEAQLRKISVSQVKVQMLFQNALARVLEDPSKQVSFELKAILSDLGFLRSSVVAPQIASQELQVERLSTDVERMEAYLHSLNILPSGEDETSGGGLGVQEAPEAPALGGVDTSRFLKFMEERLEAQRWMSPNGVAESQIDALIARTKRAQDRWSELGLFIEAITNNERRVVELANAKDDLPPAIDEQQRREWAWSEYFGFYSQIAMLDDLLSQIRAEVYEAQSVVVRQDWDPRHASFQSALEILEKVLASNKSLTEVLDHLEEAELADEVGILMDVTLHWLPRIKRIQTQIEQLAKLAVQVSKDADLPGKLRKKAREIGYLLGDPFVEVLNFVSAGATVEELPLIWREFLDLEELTDLSDLPDGFVPVFSNSSELRQWWRSFDIFSEGFGVSAQRHLDVEFQSQLEILDSPEAEDKEIEAALRTLEGLTARIAYYVHELSSQIGLEQKDGLKLLVFSKRIARLMMLKKEIQSELLDYDFGVEVQQKLYREIMGRLSECIPETYLYMVYNKLSDAGDAESLSFQVRTLIKRGLPLDRYSPEMLESIGSLRDPAKIKTALYELWNPRTQ